MFRPASIFVHGVLSWDQLQLMISKSTTADLLKMFNKLEEFFSQQFNSSKRAFSGFSSNRPTRVTQQKSKWLAYFSIYRVIFLVVLSGSTGKVFHFFLLLNTEVFAKKPIRRTAALLFKIIGSINSIQIPVAF